jgi:hypothetical protein
MPTLVQCWHLQTALTALAKTVRRPLVQDANRITLQVTNAFCSQRKAESSMLDIFSPNVLLWQLLLGTGMKALTAAITVMSTIFLVRMIPKLMSLRSSEHLEAEVKQRNEAIRESDDELHTYFLAANNWNWIALHETVMKLL